MDIEALTSIAAATCRLTPPLLLASLAGLFAERSGIFDIGLEGKMLASAFAAATVSYVAGSMWIGLAAAIAASVAFALVHGFASITLRGNQIVSGVALNFLAQGLTALLGQSWFHQGGHTPALAAGERFGSIELPFANSLRDVPLLGPLYAEVISGQNIFVYLAFAAVPASWWVLYRTHFGLRLRAVGENPTAVDTAGISVARLRYQALLIGGVMCGFAGAYLSIAQGSGFGNDMTAGKGYIALAALIFAKWRPFPVLFTTMLFGFFDALQIRLQGVPLPLIGVVPVQAIEALPYLLTVILLAGLIGKAVGPKAAGIPYLKER